MDNPKIIAVIPAYNEAATVADVVSGIRSFVQDIVVVDDCSTDGTGDAARSAGARVIRHERNAGYDGSLNDGFAEAARLGADIIVTCDADGQHRAEDLRLVCDPVIRGEADVSIGQRAQLSRMGEKIFAVFTSLRFGIKDPLCGLKAYRREVYDAIGHFDTLHSIGTQLTVEACLRGFRLKLVPVNILPRPDTSRFYVRQLRANLKILKAAARIINLTLWTHQ